MALGNSHCAPTPSKLVQPPAIDQTETHFLLDKAAFRDRFARPAVFVPAGSLISRGNGLGRQGGEKRQAEGISGAFAFIRSFRLTEQRVLIKSDALSEAG
jgi:hypothetical protein